MGQSQHDDVEQLMVFVPNITRPTSPSFEGPGQRAFRGVEPAMCYTASMYGDLSGLTHRESHGGLKDIYNEATD